MRADHRRVDLRAAPSVGRSRVPKCCAPPPGESVPAPPMPLPAAASFRSRPLQKPRPAPVRMMHADVVVGVGVGEALREQLQHLEADRVQPLGAVERDRRDVVGLLVEQIGHVIQSSFAPPRISFSIPAKARNAGAPSPANVEPCMTASVRGCRSAKRAASAMSSRRYGSVVRQRPGFVVEQRLPRPRRRCRPT